MLSRGFVTSAAALEFLSSFGGLSLACGDARLDPVDATSGIDSGWAVTYARELGAAAVTPVGTASKEHMVCLSFDDDLRVVGDDPIDGLNALCEGDDYQVIRARRHLSAGGMVDRR